MKPLLLVSLAAIAVIAYTQRTLGQAAASIQEEFGLTKDQFGEIVFAWGMAYAALQLPAGWLADRVGGRRAIVGCALLWSICTAAAGLARDRWSLMVLWGLMGAAQAGAFPAAVNLIRRWFREDERAFASGVLAGSMAVGAMVAPLSFAQWNRLGFSWRVALIGHAVPGIAWAIAFWALLPESPEPDDKPSDGTRGDSLPIHPSEQEPSVVARVATILLASGVWLLFLQQFCRAAGTTFFHTWFPTFVRETHHAGEFDSGWLASIVGLGGLIGGVFGGAFSDGLLRTTKNERLSRQGLALVGATCAALAVWGSAWAETPLAATLCMGAAAMFAAVGGVGAYTLAMRIGGRDTATIFALMNMCGNVGAAFFPWLLGLVVVRSGSWDWGVALVGAVFLGAAVCWGLLRVPPDSPLEKTT